MAKIINHLQKIINIIKQTLKKVQELEKRLREETGEEIILIAYKHERGSK